MQENELVRIISEYLESKRVHESKRMYNLNIIDELHANENAHTRILLKLFSYELDGKKIILEKFIDRINQKIGNPERAIKSAENAKVFYQFAFMDGYIKSSDDWAIIIENKINWAADQENQIDRYIQSAIDDGIAENKIYAVYLTADGSKKVSDYSFDKERNGNIGGFVELNYQDDILPLLKNTAGELPEKEIVLTAAITQYIDYLEGRLGMRENEKEYNTAMNKTLLEILNLSGTGAEKYEQIEGLQWELWNRLDSLKHEVYPNQPAYIASQLRDFLYQNSAIISPFSQFKLYLDTCVLAWAWAMPLSDEKDKCFAVDIGIKSESTFAFNIHIVNENGHWVDSDTFQGQLKKHESLLAYLESNKKFSKDEQSYEFEGNFKDVTDLQNTILGELKNISPKLKN